MAVVFTKVTGQSYLLMREKHIFIYYIHTYISTHVKVYAYILNFRNNKTLS